MTHDTFTSLGLDDLDAASGGATPLALGALAASNPSLFAAPSLGAPTIALPTAYGFADPFGYGLYGAVQPYAAYGLLAQHAALQNPIATLLQTFAPVASPASSSTLSQVMGGLGAIATLFGRPQGLSGSNFLGQSTGAQSLVGQLLASL